MGNQREGQALRKNQPARSEFWKVFHESADIPAGSGIKHRRSIASLTRPIAARGPVRTGTLSQVMSHVPAYRGRMNSKYTHAKTGYGVLDTRNAVAERIRREFEAVENPPRRRVKTGAELLADMQRANPMPVEKRPLAA